MKKPLRIAAAVIVVGAIAFWLWPSEAPTPPPTPAPMVLQKHVVEETGNEPHREERDRIRVTFINHLGDANIKFTVDGIFVCTADAGKACYGDVVFGKHVVEALEGNTVVRTLDLTLDKESIDPKVVVCFPTSPNC